MSRSYKKCHSAGPSRQKWMKKWANRKVRHKKLEETYQNKTYKKVFNDLLYDHWRIFSPSFTDYVKEMERFRPGEKLDNEDLWRDYIKYYMRK